MDPNTVPTRPEMEPETPPAAPEPEAPPSPQVDLDTAYQVITQHEGWDPRLTRYEIQELKRRRDELDRERREFEAQKNRGFEPPEDTSDPYMNRISRLERILIEDREEKRREKEEQARNTQVARDLEFAYTQVARGAGMTPEQIQARSAEFFDVLAEFYPDPEMVQRIGPDRAVRAAFRSFGNGNGYRSPAPQVNGRGPTATLTMPRATTVSDPQPMDDGGPQRPGETLEDYVMRRRKWREENRISTTALMREGVRYSTE